MVGTVAYMRARAGLGRDARRRAATSTRSARMLYEMVTGRPPFLGDDAVGVISQHINTPPVAPSWHNAGRAAGARGAGPAPAGEGSRRPPGVGGRRWRGAAPHAVERTRRRRRRRRRRAARRAGRVGVFVGRAPTSSSSSRERRSTTRWRAGARLVMLVGEPGIGKTPARRGARRLRRRCAAPRCCGATATRARAASPYLPVRRGAARLHARDPTDDELRAELGRGAPEVAHARVRAPRALPRPAAAARRSSRDAERLRLFEGVTTFLRNAARRQPLVLVLDDLHWADKPTLLLLQHLARELSTATGC